MKLPRALLMSALLATGACAAAGPPGEPGLGHGDARTITTLDLVNATQLSLLDFIVAQRPQWLRSPNGQGGAVNVYLNDAPFGGTVALRDITLSQVVTARYFDLAAAQQRYSARLNGPVIAVTTR